jgi:MYXO-CTERM domain-containing protein
MTDLELRVATTLAGPKSSTLTFPLISVINGAETAFGARLEVTLPAEVTLVSVSASNASCSGNRVLTCDFADLDPLATATVALSVRGTATGSFKSSLKLTATNDNNAANDSRDVAVEIAGGDPAAVSGGSAGGGGGRMEWLALLLLAALVLRRTRKMGAAPFL